MSDTATAPIADDTTRTAIFHVQEDQAAEILTTFDVPLPAVLDLDEIRIVICHPKPETRN